MSMWWTGHQWCTASATIMRTDSSRATGMKTSLKSMSAR
jgi:hypothetical protein